MKFLLTSLVGLVILFSGCTTSPNPISINTYNKSYYPKSNQKSTQTYPGSAQRPIVSKPTIMEQPTAPVDSTMSITSTDIITPSLNAEGEPFIEEQKTYRPIFMAGPMIKIAVLVPQKTIKKYAITTVNSSIAYLLYKNYNFDLNVFNSGDEKEESIAKSLEEIRAGGYTYIIAPMTPDGARIVANNVKDLMVFIPTLHNSSVPNAGANIFFGGIDYNQQIAQLSEFANDKVATFEDGSGLSYQLNGMVKQNSQRVFYEKRVENSKANFKQLFKGNTSLNNASIFLNTPLVTTSLIASQLRVYDIFPHLLLSTQISYNPLLLTLTQYEDRDKMVIANSIQKTPAELEETNSLFGHDIVYDWVNYATSIGTDLLCNHFYEQKANEVFKEQLINNQVVYKTEIYKPGRNEFIKTVN